MLCHLIYAVDPSRARAVLAGLVAELTGDSEGKITLEQTCRGCGSSEHGPLTVRGQSERIQVSIARANYACLVGAVVACEGGLAPRIGVDLEDVPTDTSTRLDEAVVPAGVLVGLQRGNTRERRRAFTRHWTRNEALSKATGWGLLQPMDQIEAMHATNAASMWEHWLADDLHAAAAVLTDRQVAFELRYA